MNSQDTPDNPLVSIFIPTFNRANYLDDCLYSVLAQDYPNYEILVRDNASTDDTITIVKKYEPQFSHIAGFRYKRNEMNVGFRDNIVHGVAECQGKYALILMDDDFLCSKTAIRSLVRALLATDKTALAVAATISYLEGQESLSPKEIIDQGRNHTTNASFTTVPGEEYFLNLWSKYSFFVLSSTMFDTRLLLKSAWAEWSRTGGVDSDLYHALPLNQNVAISHDFLAFYRIHSSQIMQTFSLEDALQSHGNIMKWYEYAKRNSRIPRISLFLWRLKTVILKDEGILKRLHDRNPPQLEPFLRWLKQHSYLHYVILRYLSPIMIKYDYEAANKSRHWLIRTFRKTAVWSRSIIMYLVLITDRVWHDPETRAGIKRRLNRLILRRAPTPDIIPTP